MEVRTASPSVRSALLGAREAARALARADREVKDAGLARAAQLLRERSQEILDANAEDLADERAAGLNDALRDRLALTPDRVEAMAVGVEAVAALDDPVGELLDAATLASGIEMRKVRVPLGVVAVIYEARPNVTIDCAALCIKSGNAIVLRGSSYAERSNSVLAEVFSEALSASALPASSVSLLSGERSELAELATAEGLVDLVIPRGGEGLKAALKEVATVPVMYAAAGICHVYVDGGADPEVARAITVDAKVQRPGVCNAAETLLVHSSQMELLRDLLRDLADAGVEIVGDQRTVDAAEGVEVSAASPADWSTEYHDMKISVRVVDSVDEAVEHINQYGTHHSDAIVTTDEDAAETFTNDVDSACVYVNASTRFTDGFEFGMGAEIGNSTQKLHARGPIGMRELTTYRYVLRGDGQTRG